MPLHPVRYTQKDLQDIIKATIRNGDIMLDGKSTIPHLLEMCAVKMFKECEVVTDRAVIVRQALNDLSIEGQFVYRK